MNMNDEKTRQFEADQAEIRLLVWQNKIPVKLTLSTLCISSDKEPLPFYTFFQRVHHPIFYYKQIHEYFEKFAPLPRNASDIWLEWNGQPIHWNIPFGVTFDLNYVDENLSGEFHTMTTNQDDLSTLLTMPFYPVQIVVHYGPSPPEILAIEPGKDVLSVGKANFKFNLKEALLIRIQTTFVLTQVNLNEQELFLNSFLAMQEKEFFPILDVIFSLKSIVNNNSVIKLPLRVYIRNYPGRVQLAEIISTGEERLGDLLVRILPKVVQYSSNSDTATSSFKLVSDARASDFKAICNGIICPLSMPLLYFYKHFFHYDGFTYLAIQI